MKLKTKNIKGKEYVEVSERIRAFRMLYPSWSLETVIISITDEKVVMQAIVKDESGRIIATGTAYEISGNSQVNKTSYIENCETSAWGRALGNLGIGLESSIATADEVEQALYRQNLNLNLNQKGPTPENTPKAKNEESNNEEEKEVFQISEKEIEEVDEILIKAFQIGDIQELRNFYSDNLKNWKSKFNEESIKIIVYEISKLAEMIEQNT